MRADPKAEFATSICFEKPTQHNPFLAQNRFIRGYDIQDLWRRSTFFDVFILHFVGELPEARHRQAMETLFVGLMNLGPRDVAVRAAMLAGVTKTRPEHLLSIGLLANQGQLNGAKEVELALQFMRAHVGEPASECVQKHLELLDEQQRDDNTAHVIPGFGGSYGDVDPIIQQLAGDLSKLLRPSAVMTWCNELVDELLPLRQGWLAPGLVAAVCLDIGIGAREAIGVYQIAKSVGVVAQAMEQTHNPISEAPMLGDDCYEYQS